VEPQHENRRLTTILAADVVGYSRLMAADESQTLAQLKAHRRELIEPKTDKHHGRVVKLMGDGTLMEFGSVVDAVNFAIDVQKAMAERNSDVSVGRQVIYRFGINIGDIIVEGDDIYGDGVNVAARLEGLADPGGICIARNVFNQVKSKLDISFEDMGEQELKNIPEPIRAYRIVMGEKDVGLAATTDTPEPLSVPDKPSIAVLPFDNMSGDPEQAYFAQGIADDIITGLSKNQWLFVIARNSSFIYSGGSVDIKRIGRELGVRYVLEGSVRRGGNRVRVNAQLIEAQTMHHVWADHYDGKLDDVFALQDQITTRILSALGPELTTAEIERSRLVRSQDFDAWDRYLQALPHAYEITKQGFDRAGVLLSEAIERDPEFSSAYAMLCHSYSLAAFHGWLPKVRQAIRQSIEFGDRAVALDPQNPIALANLGWAHVFLGPQDKAVRMLRRALELDPNSTHAWSALGCALGFMGEPDQAMAAIENAKRGSPRDPMRWLWFLGESIANFAANQLEIAIDAAKNAIQLQPSWYGSYPLLAASAAHLDRMDVAQDAVATLLKLIPRFSMRGAERNPIFERTDDVKRMIDGLRLAGLPE
jgi:adenylate cyclase